MWKLRIVPKLRVDKSIISRISQWYGTWTVATTRSVYTGDGNFISPGFNRRLCPWLADRELRETQQLAGVMLIFPFFLHVRGHGASETVVSRSEVGRRVGPRCNAVGFTDCQYSEVHRAPRHSISGIVADPQCAAGVNFLVKCIAPMRFNCSTSRRAMPRWRWFKAHNDVICWPAIRVLWGEC